MKTHNATITPAPAACQLNGVLVRMLAVALVASTIVASSAALCIAKAHGRNSRRTKAIKLVTDQGYEFSEASIKAAELWLQPEPLVSFPLVFPSVFGRLHRQKPFGNGVFVGWGAQSINFLSNFGNKIKHGILGFNAFAVDIVKPRNKTFWRNLVFWIVRHKKSRLCCDRIHVMDDGGWYGNVPPNPLQKHETEREKMCGRNATEYGRKR